MLRCRLRKNSAARTPSRPIAMSNVHSRIEGRREPGPSSDSQKFMDEEVEAVRKDHVRPRPCWARGRKKWRDVSALVWRQRSWKGCGYRPCPRSGDIPSNSCSDMRSPTYSEVFRPTTSDNLEGRESVMISGVLKESGT